jgi:hypothetical protein
VGGTTGETVNLILTQRKEPRLEKVGAFYLRKQEEKQTMLDETNQAQVETTAEAPEAGSESQPAETQPEVEQPGTEEKPSGTKEAITETKPGKSYSEEEVTRIKSEITSKLQGETEQYKKFAAQLAMQQQLAKMQAEEQQAASKDAQDVANGVIGQQEAEQRKTQRTEASQLQQTLTQQKQQGEMLGRILMAQDLAKKYGIDSDTLLKDQALRTPTDMILKAADLAIKSREDKLREATAKPETYDKGPGAETGGGDDSKLSARELAQKK